MQSTLVCATQKKRIQRKKRVNPMQPNNGRSFKAFNLYKSQKNIETLVRYGAHEVAKKVTREEANLSKQTYRIGFAIACVLTMPLLLLGCTEKSSVPSSSTADTAALEKGNEINKLENLTKLAGGGDAEAMYELSQLYLSGKEVEYSHELYRNYLGKAAEKNHPKAVYELATSINLNIDIPLFIEGASNEEKFAKGQKDYREAERLYLKAIDLGVAEANHGLGNLYLYGLDGLSNKLNLQKTKVPKDLQGDIEKAIKYFEQAANLGVPRSMVAMYRLHSVTEYKRVNRDEANRWLQKASELENPKDLGEAASALYHGSYTNIEKFKYVSLDEFNPEQSWAKDAKPLLERAANAGDVASQILLSKILLNGYTGYKDESLGVKYLAKAAAANDTWSQVMLGRRYMSGSSVFQDYSTARENFFKAASSEKSDIYGQEAQYLLGILAENGFGVEKDLVLAHAWYNIAATNGYEKAEPRRSIITRKLSAEELAEAQTLAKNWKPGDELNRSSSHHAVAQTAGEPKKTNTGTMFYISSDGFAVTNNHVVAECRQVKIEGSSDSARIVTQDAANDLALIKIDGGKKQHAEIIANPSKIRQGEEIVVFGFPLNSLLSSGGNLTPGVVSALTGLGNNTNQIQITAAIQPGSSGSPVLNSKGDVVGVVSSKLSDSKMAKATGQVGQTINFAISAQTLKSFLDAHRIDYTSGAKFISLGKDAADLAAEARKWTTVVECWK